MQASLLRDAVETQRRELRSRLAERYIQRQLAQPIRDDGLIKVIIGPRRCGKSFLRCTSVTRCKSVHTVAKYIGYLEEAFLFFSLSRFSFKAREQVAANRKIYCIDNGMITARGVLFSADTGRLVENLVAVALRKRALDGACELFFWKDAQQREVDFVIKEGRSVTQLIQVCWDLTAASTREREIRALLRAGDDLSCDRLLLLTADTDSEEEVEWYGRKGRIRLLPVWRWLSGEGLT